MSVCESPALVAVWLARLFSGMVIPHSVALLLTATLLAGDLPGAGKVYQKLKKLAPQSEETIAARELIKAAVIKGK